MFANKFFRIPARYAVKPFLQELANNQELFEIGQKRKAIEVQRETNSIILRNVVPIQGVPTNHNQSVKDVVDWEKFPVSKMFLDNFIKDFGGEMGRALWVKLPPDKKVYPHIDEGTYYSVRDRFHLVVQGIYRYTVGDETQVFIPGDLWWFNNQLTHEAHNISNEDRIALIFDVKDSKWRETFFNEQSAA